MKKNVRRSILFVPALRIDRIEKAIKTETDSITIDMEDAVSPEFKNEGRDKCVKALETINFNLKEVIVRVNPINTLNGIEDLVALKNAKNKPDIIMLPKTENKEQVILLSTILNEIDSEIRIIAIIESSIGIANAFEIANASKKTIGICFGGGDLSGDLGCKLEWESMFYTRQAVKVAAASAQIDCIDVPYLNIKDEDGLVRECEKVKEIGYNTKIAIHPCQLAAINKVFYPSEKEISWAKTINDAVKTQGKGAIVVNGKMIDAAIVKRSDKILQLVNEFK